MTLVKLFKSPTENFDEKNPMALISLETSIGAAMLMKKVVQISGPYANFLPLEKPGDPLRVFYTASVLYSK